MDERNVTLALKEYVSPGCPCGIEDRIQALHGVHEVHVNPVADTVHLAYDAQDAPAAPSSSPSTRCGCGGWI